MVAYERVWAKIELGKEYQAEASSSVANTVTYKYACPHPEEAMLISEVRSCYALDTTIPLRFPSLQATQQQYEEEVMFFPP